MNRARLASATMFAVILCAGALTAGCKKDEARKKADPATEGKEPVDSKAGKATDATPEPAAPAGNWYRAALVFEKNGELPFFLDLPKEPAKGEGAIQNADERVPMDYEWKGNQVTIDTRWNYVNRIVAVEEADGSLKGKWTRDTPLWGEVVRPFKASKIDKPDPALRFPGDKAAPDKAANDVTGVWKFKFETHGEGKGNLRQTPDGAVTSYIRPAPLGDFRFMTGNVRGDKVLLSTFNGNVANLIDAKLTDGGKKMKGTINMQNVWIEPFTAEKVDDFELANPVHMKKGKKTISVPELKKYKGKPVVLKIFATWCPICNDAAPFFTQLYSDYHPKGLEMLSVAYDLTEDEKVLKEKVARYKDIHKVTWEVSEVTTTPQEWAGDMPPEVEGWLGFPVIAWIRPDGTVYKVYGGYYGPAAQPEHEKINAQFRQWTDELLAGK